MVLALTANIVLSLVVFAAVIALIMRAIRSPRSASPAVVPAGARLGRARQARAREHRSAGLAPAQTAWTSTPAASRIRTPAAGGSET